MTELEKALHGLTYNSRDPEVQAHTAFVSKLCYRFNQLSPDNPERREILTKLFAESSDYVFVESGFQCVFGKNIYFRGMAMLNFNCTFLDSAKITIGHLTLIGPGCSLVCTNHSIDPTERLQGVFHNQPITIGSRVWLGAHVIVCPGVTIGDDTVIGAGSVVSWRLPFVLLIMAC